MSASSSSSNAPRESLVNWHGVSVAKQRWKILAKALKESRLHQLEATPGSLRAFSTFQLLQMLPLHNIDFEENRGPWFECFYTEYPHFRLWIRLLSNRITIEDLNGFDNTGNICIWPSEEVLGYYCLKNKEMFWGKSVCELGGGMTCLSGLAVAAAADAKEIFLTDGNLKSVQNVQVVINHNITCFGTTDVKAKLLRWDVEEDIREMKLRFDIILCADCLYFDEGRIPLANTIWKILKDNGLVIILAPPRGHTFQHFVEMVQDRFHFERLLVYDTHVWELHRQFQEERNDIYDESLHYPHMLILKKT